MLQAGEDGGNERLQDLLLSDSAQEPQRGAPDILVGVLQVVSQVLADQNLQAGASENVADCPKEFERQVTAVNHTLTISGRSLPPESVFSIVSCKKAIETCTEILHKNHHCRTFASLIV